MSEEFQPKDVQSSAAGNPSSAGDITSDDKLWVLLVYIISPLIPAITYLLEDKKNRPFIRAHNAQALIWGLLMLTVGTLLSAYLSGLPTLAMLIVSIYWGIKGYQGEYITIPVITDFVKQQRWN